MALLKDSVLSSEEDGSGSFLWLDAFKRQYVYGAMSFAAVDADNQEPVIVFLAETTAHRVLRPEPVVLHPEVSGHVHTLQVIGSQAFVCLSELLGLRLVTH